MEIKQAIERINRFILWMSGQTQEALETAIKALEKQIPKKPLSLDRNQGYFECSDCNFLISYTDSENTHKYCLNCGQKIDWS